MTWHVAEDDVRAYARGELAPPMLWSADTHLAQCADCRALLASVSDPVALDAGWERLDAELDAPKGGLLESLLVRVGVADHTARLLSATPVLRRSWLGAVVALLVMTVLVTNAQQASVSPTLFLVLAPCSRSAEWPSPTARGSTPPTRWPSSPRCTASGSS